MHRPSLSLSRRAVLQAGLLCLASGNVATMLAESATAAPLVCVGLLTDIHYGDKPPSRTRFYRESLAKMEEAVAAFNKERPDFIVEIGDLIDKADTVELELTWLDAIEKRFAAATAPRHYVLGNHCVDTLTKEEFAAHTGASETPHYSFDQGGLHFVILDACYRSDGEPYGRKHSDWQDANVPPAELEWLRNDLLKSNAPVVVFAHQRLDVAAPHSVRNAAAVRELLEKGGRTLAVFQGHSHKNDYQQIAGIHYVTHVAMIEGTGLENSGYSFLEIMPDHSLRVRGFRRQENRTLARG